MFKKHDLSSGFTLIELSIVLVIIGLIVGGVLVAQDLIKAAETRSQLAQLEKYSTAINSFRNKYGYLPGDIPEPYASRFSFQPRGTNPGEGDGNGFIKGYTNFCGAMGISTLGEGILFWSDLSSANLIAESFTTATYNSVPYATSGNGRVPLFIPRGKIPSTMESSIRVKPDLHFSVGIGWYTLSISVNENRLFSEE